MAPLVHFGSPVGTEYDKPEPKAQLVHFGAAAAGDDD